MTGIEKIKSKIIEDAAALAARIEEQTGTEAADILRQASEEAEKRKTELLDKARSEGAERHRRLLTQAALEGRKEILRTKQSLIDRAFQMAMEKLCALPDSEYQKLLEDMIVNAACNVSDRSAGENGEKGGVSAVGKSGGEIMLSGKDIKRIDDSFSANINQRLDASGKGGMLTLSTQTVNAAGGFILKNGDMEINSTFEIVFGMLRTELERDVVRILFGEVS